jgi:S-DNA-T family DNA segregation ATPase FtsK/SpoIIIE
MRSPNGRPPRSSGPTFLESSFADVDVSFVRTPDRVLRERRARGADTPSSPMPASPAPLLDPDLPSWLQPFAPGPDIRYTRTPDSILRRKPADAEVESEAEPTAILDTAPFETVAEPEAHVPPEPEAADPGPLVLVRRRRRRPQVHALAAMIQLGWDEDPRAANDLDGPILQQQDACADLPHQDTPAAPEPAPLVEAPPAPVLMAPIFTATVRFAPLSGSWRPSAPAPVALDDHDREEMSFEDEADLDDETDFPAETPQPAAAAPPAPTRVTPRGTVDPSPASRRGDAPIFGEYELPPLDILAEPRDVGVAEVAPEVLEQNAAMLEQTLCDFNVRGDIINVRPGPVVTLYELEPAPGTKSSRVISLADDIARSMSAVSARVAVVQGRNAIGIELPNVKRETVYLRELLASQDFEGTKQRLALCLGKTIGGEPVIADLARMPHLLVAGTTGSGKSVAINTMILSILYRLKPEECRLIMVDPKMLELSVYDGIPHLLTPVVTDPKKAVVALKWAVREMEERYKKMSKVGVRNIDGFNARVAEAAARGEVITRTVQTGFDRETGQAVYEDEVMDLDPLPFIVVIVDEMADLMMVAGKEIEGAIQRLAQMARAAGIHLIMATQRPSVDVITGTIKANFPTRISFQVTSKIDSRTILGEMGAEQLLGQGDMLYMAGGGRITRVHGPFVADDEVEKIVAHLKRQGRPRYLEAVTSDEESGGAAEEEDGAVFDKGAFGEPGGDVYDQAVAVVLRDKKASTSYIQRRLQIGYNRAASLMERMEREGIVGPANHAGKREILMEGATHKQDFDDEE